MEKFTTKYKDLIYESLEDKFKDKLTEEYLSLKKGVLKLVEDSVDDSELVDVQNFMNNYSKDDSKEALIGFVDSADIYNFYLKYMGQIDELCNDKNYFDDIPSKNNIFSLYDYTIDGTNFATKEIIKILLDELY